MVSLFSSPVLLGKVKLGFFVTSFINLGKVVLLPAFLLLEARI